MTKILVSTPSMYQGIPFLPYIYGLLRIACRSLPKDLQSQLKWQEPIYSNTIELEELCRQIDRDPPDVLALSCYIWNWEFQIKLAKYVKENFPDCLVIAGGPQPDWKDALFFEQNPFIDIVIKGEGEVTFAKIIEMRCSGSQDFEEIDGVWTKNNNSQKNDIKVLRNDLKSVESPYLNFPSEYARFTDHLREKNLVIWANWETNRGCPYKCCFCDWGSATHTKLRYIDEERLEKEAEWFGQNKIDTVYITDSNFGILPRDEQITDLLVKVREKYNYPRTVFFSSPKNNPDRLVKIIKKFHDAGLMQVCIQNNLQSTQAHVLKTMQRINIPADKHKKFIQSIHDLNMPIGAALIVGNPNESLEDFKNSMFDVIEWGQHDELRIFNWELLPNAPAAQPQFMKENKIKTIRRYSIRPAVHRKNSLNPLLGYSDYLVEHSRLSRDEFVECLMYSTYLLVYHFLGITKYTSAFLRFHRDIPYKAFYESLIKRTRAMFGEAEQAIYENFVKFINEENSYINMSLNEEMDTLVDAEAWVFMHLVNNREKTKECILQSLAEIGELNDISKSVVDFNKEFVIYPDYDFKVGHEFTTDYKWTKFFDEALTSAWVKHIELPDKGKFTYKFNTQYTGHYDNLALNFNEGTKKERLTSYVNSVVGTRSTRNRRSTFQSYQLNGNANQPSVQIRTRETLSL